jgi:hypothetical protein
MRHCCLIAVFLSVAAIVPAQADKRIFIVSNNADGYGVDRCLANGAACGRPIATAYCQSREFHTAVSFRKIERDDITGAIPTKDGACANNRCEDFVAIECDR